MTGRGDARGVRALTGRRGAWSNGRLMSLMSLRNKHEALTARLRALGRVAVAYSAGIDSTYLLKAATVTLGAENALGLTAQTPSLPAVELAQARRIAAAHGFQHVVVATHEIDDPRYAANPVNRCYFCKSELYTTLAPLAQARGFPCVASGTNADDLGDWRPGLAAAAESGVVHPLLEAGLTKEEIRTLAREAGLENWAKPAAACLASRFPHGTEVTRERLAMVEAAEDYLRAEVGLGQLRVRWIDGSARIECEREEMGRVLGRRSEIAGRLEALGFREVSLDLRGYRRGALHEELVQIAIPR